MQHGYQPGHEAGTGTASSEPSGDGGGLGMMTLPRIISLFDISNPEDREEEPYSLVETTMDERAVNPTERLEKEDVLRTLLRGCSRTERLILICYYYEEMTMKEIGAALDFSESRVSQLHSALMERKKALLRDRNLTF